MKETFDDGKLYSEDQDFGSISVRNYKEVLGRYDYSRYVHRFRTMADAHKLSATQRPKLNEGEFASLIKKLTDALLRLGEQRLLDNGKHEKIATRLLLFGTRASLFDEDFCGMGYSNWVTGKSGDF